MTRRQAYKEARGMIRKGEIPPALAVALMAQARANGRRGFKDTMSCPACKHGRVTFAIAESNGHVMGKCSTPGCVAFIQ